MLTSLATPTYWKFSMSIPKFKSPGPYVNSLKDAINRDDHTPIDSSTRCEFWFASKVRFRIGIIKIGKTGVKMDFDKNVACFDQKLIPYFDRIKQCDWLSMSNYRNSSLIRRDFLSNFTYKGYHIRLYHLVIGWRTLECNIWFMVPPH